METIAKAENSTIHSSILDYIKFCRVCMAQSDEAMTEIFSDSMEFDSISHRIKFCTGLELQNSNGFLTQICSLCLRTLDIAYKFKTSCLHADKKYRDLLQDFTLVKSDPDSKKDFDVPIVDNTEVKQESIDVIIDDNIKSSNDLANHKYLNKTDKEMSKEKGGYKKVLVVKKVKALNSNPIRLRGELSNIRFKSKQQLKIHNSQSHTNGEDAKWSDIQDNMAADFNENTESYVTSDCNGKRSTEQKDNQETVAINLGSCNKDNSAAATAVSAKQPGKGRRKYRRLFCEACRISFKDRQHSEEHKKTCRARAVCEICGKVCSRKSMYAHAQTHYPPVHACPDCSYKTCHKHDLIKHIMTHTNEKRYQCEYCTKLYRTSSALSSHIKRAHEGLKKFFCEICSHGFFERNKYQRHMDTHSNIKRFDCQVCHTKFARRCYWKKHLQKQHGITTPAKRPGQQPTYSLDQDPETEAPLTSHPGP